MSSKFFSVLTTIHEPKPTVRKFSESIRRVGGHLIVVGDAKGPADYDLKGVCFLSLEQQFATGIELARILPTGHYARKNVGYLYAIARGAELIYETDDDNEPHANWHRRREYVPAYATSGDGWVNIYRMFTKKKIWPRGFPIDSVSNSLAGYPVEVGEQATFWAPVQQGLADGSPDVDAVWRLVIGDSFYFDQGPSVLVSPGCWCPFNSQSTWWWPAAFPLLYLPSHCSFRMTDIWRSLIAQRCLWELNAGVVFHAPEVFQERNEHDLMRDFSDEIPGYTRNREMATILEGLSLSTGRSAVPSNLLQCYEALVSRGFFPEDELELVECWLEDFARTTHYRSALRAALCYA